MSINYPSNSDDGGGFYAPDTRPYAPLENYEDFINSTNGVLAVQDTDAIHNLINELPLLRQWQLSLGGEELFWLSRITFGTRCPQFNYVNDECGESKCRFCFGTGYLGGYKTPAAIKVSFTPGKADIQLEQAGLTVTQRPTAWTINTRQIISERDMFITYSNERYEVHSAEFIEIQGRRTYQELTLSRIDKFDPKYNVPVPGFQGQGRETFIANVTIRPPRVTFPATVLIRNFNIYPNDGMTY